MPLRAKAQKAHIEEISALKGLSEPSIGMAAQGSWAESEGLSKLCKETFNNTIQIYADKLIANGFNPETAWNIGIVFQAMLDGSLILSVTRHDARAFEEVQN